MTHRTGKFGMTAYAMLIGMGLSIVSCSTQRSVDDNMQRPADRNERVVDGIDAEDRRAAVNELEDVRDRIDKRIDEVDRSMKNSENERYLTELRDYRLELERNRARVTDEIRNIEVSETSRWDDVRNTASATAKDVAAWFERQGDRLERIVKGDDADDDMMDDDND